MDMVDNDGETLQEERQEMSQEEPQPYTLADIAEAIESLASVVAGIVESISVIDGRLDALTAARIDGGAEFTDGSVPDDIQDAADGIEDDMPEVVTMETVDNLDLDL